MASCRASFYFGISLDIRTFNYTADRHERQLAVRYLQVADEFRKTNNMGYDIHITRKEFWADEDDSKNISLDEWTSFLKTQPDMRLDNFAEADLSDGSTLRHESDGIAVWTSYSGNGKDGNYAWFYYDSGEIRVKNPDDELLLKICDIAKKINATVQGDDGEFYENGQIKADT